MSDTIRARTSALAREHADILPSDGDLQSALAEILDLCAMEESIVRVRVLAKGTSNPIVEYVPSSWAPPTVNADDHKKLDAPTYAVDLEIDRWRPSELAGAFSFDGLTRDLETILTRHWCVRATRTLLPRLDLSDTAARLHRWVQSRAIKSPCAAVFFTDLDNFKQINEKVSYDAGNSVLGEFGARLRKHFSAIGVPVQWGGDEFGGVIFVDRPVEALERLEAFRREMENKPFAAIGRPNTCTLGLAIFDQPNLLVTKNADELFAEAKAAEQFAKTEGKNCIRLSASKTPDTCELISADEVRKAALLSRMELPTTHPTVFHGPFENAIAHLLVSQLTGKKCSEVPAEVQKLRQALGVEIRSEAKAGNTVSPAISVTDWAALVGRAVLKAAYDNALIINADLMLKFVQDTDGLHLELMQKGEEAVRVGLHTASTGELDVPIGAPWVTTPSAHCVTRWLTTEKLNGLSPCLLVPIGDAVDQARDLGLHVSELIELDDRPVLGGGLPDFWQSNISRIIRACLANPNIETVLVVGPTDGAPNTLQRLRATPEDWEKSVHELQRSLSISVPHLRAFRERNLSIEQIDGSRSAILESLVAATAKATSINVEDRVRINVSEEKARRKRLPLQHPPEDSRLRTIDGMRARSLADAYPQAIQLLRSSTAPAQDEPSGRSFRELSAFKLVLSNPLHDLVPDYWEGEGKKALEDYYQNTFIKDGALFGKELVLPRNGGESSSREFGLRSTLDALKSLRPTRRILLPVASNDLEKPLGLAAIQISPRFREERRWVDIQWVWRTVDALVGFPFSAYGSIRWTEDFVFDLKRRAGDAGLEIEFETGELTYIALSFHFYLDGGDQDIAHAVVQDAIG